MLIRNLTVGATLLIAGQSYAADTMLLSSDDLSTRQLMLFQSGHTLFTEQYRLPHKLTEGRVEISGINPQLEPGTTLIEGAGRIDSLRVGHQWAGVAARLQPLIGQTLTLKRYLDDDGSVYREAKLLGIDGDRLLLEDSKGVEYLPLSGPWQPVLPEQQSRYSLPSLLIERNGDASDTLSLSYLGGGLGWQADHALTLDESIAKLELKALATIHNQSAVDLPGSQVRLLAGKVNQPQGMPPRYLAKTMETMAADSTLPEQQAFEDYHLYTLPRKIDLLAGTSVSVPLMPVLSLDYTSRYRFQMPVYGNAQPEPIKGRPQRTINFTLPLNDRNSTPLPSGMARVYIKDSKQGLSYIGGQTIPAHAAGEQVEMMLGEAFDIGIEQTQSRYERLGNTTRLAYQVTLGNAGEETKTVELTANFNQNWQITQSSQPAESQGAQALWRIQVPAKGKTTLSYQVELTRR